MNEKYITAGYMAISGAAFCIAIATSTNTHEFYLSMGMIWLLNVIIRLNTDK